MALGADQVGFRAVAGLALGLSLILWAAGDTSFERIVGPVPLPLAVAGAALAGFRALRRLAPGRELADWRRMAAIGAVFVVPAIAIDLALPFPDDLNAPFPVALAFYPAVGFVAEGIFHLLPLGVMAAALGRGPLPPWAYLPAVLAEPAFQAAASGVLTPQGVLVALHVAVFGAVQLWIFRRHGFMAMYVLRIAFYLFWHIVWGAVRLALLFP